MREKAFNITKNPKYDGYQRGLLQWFILFFGEKTSAMRANKFACSDIKSETMSNKVLAEELHEPIISKF